MLANIKQDLVAFSRNGSVFVKLKCVLFSHSFHLVVLYRVGCVLSKVPIAGSVFRVALEYIIHVLYSSDISLKSKIGPGLMIVHGHDIVIGSEVTIGQKCKILNGVTLGNKNTESSVNEQPVVGNNCIISTGAKILGKIVIGDNCIIGANAVVIHDVPSNSVAVGVPAKVIKNDG